MTTLPGTEADSDERVIAAEWSKFSAWFADAWQPGQHVALIGPTGEGKSTFAGHILNSRQWVMALDPKGEDETLSSTGFKRLTKWPPPGRDRDKIAEGKPMRYIIGGSTRTRAELERLSNLMRQAVEGCRSETGWTIYADEFQLLSDPRMFGLGPDIETLLISARSNGTSVVTAFQAPAWVSKAATRQATFTVIWPTRDRNMIKSVAEAMGRPWKELGAAVDELPSYHTLIIPKRIRAPMVLTHAPKLGRPGSPAGRTQSSQQDPQNGRRTRQPR